MTETMQLLFSQQFLLRALIVGVLVSLCCALLGVSLVLKHFSMIGDGLSHVAFGAMAIACAANIAPIYFALPIVIICAFFLLRISEKGKIKGDAAIALLSTGALALGVMVTSMTTGMNIDIYNYMFGSILTMSSGDVVISTVLSIVVILLYAVFYHEIFAVTFDESFAKATGTKASFYNMLIAALTAVTIVIGMKMMGALLISSLIIFPTVTSMRLCKSFRGVVLCSSMVSVFCFLSGLIFSIGYEAPTGASVVCVNMILLAVFSAVAGVLSSNLSGKAKKTLTALLCIVSVGAFGAMLCFGSVLSEKDSGKVSVVTTTFAPYDFARQIGGEEAEVTMLLSPGMESHTYEPTPGDIMIIRDCDVFVYGGGESENWVEEILESLDSSVKTVKMMDAVELYEEETAEGMETEIHGDEEEEEETEYDEHVWTSPLNAVKIVRAISGAMIEADDEKAELFEENTEQYISELMDLDREFTALFAGGVRNRIIVGDRFPLRYFTERYALDYYAAFPGCSAQTEANPKTIAFLIQKTEEEEIPVIFKVDLSKGSVAYTISEATGAKVDTLYSCHVISSADFDAGETYISLMRRNMSALSAAVS